MAQSSTWDKDAGLLIQHQYLQLAGTMNFLALAPVLETALFAPFKGTDLEVLAVGSYSSPSWDTADTCSHSECSPCGWKSRCDPCLGAPVISERHLQTLRYLVRLYRTLPYKPSSPFWCPFYRYDPDLSMYGWGHSSDIRSAQLYPKEHVTFSHYLTKRKDKCLIKERRSCWH